MDDHIDAALGPKERAQEHSFFISSLAPIAQSVEQLPFKEWVVGSNPTGRTNKYNYSLIKYMFLEILSIIMGCLLLFMGFNDFKKGVSSVVNINLNKTTKLVVTKDKEPWSFRIIIVAHLLSGLVLIFCGVYLMLN